MHLTEADREQLRGQAISVDEIERQLSLFRKPKQFLRLVRPCTVGDGIRRITANEIDELLALHTAAAASGRFARFVPASGAATRMFRDLLVYQKVPGRETAWPIVLERAASGDKPARSVVRFMEELPRFAFWDDLCGVLGSDRPGEFVPVLDALLGPGGLGTRSCPRVC